MVTVVVPRVAAAVAEKYTVEVQVGLHGSLVKPAVTPEGRVEVIEKVTGIADPLVKVAAIDDVELVLPWKTVRLSGDGVERLKLKACVVEENFQVSPKTAAKK